MAFVCSVSNCVILNAMAPREYVTLGRKTFLYVLKVSIFASCDVAIRVKNVFSLIFSKMIYSLSYGSICGGYLLSFYSYLCVV